MRTLGLILALAGCGGLPHPPSPARARMMLENQTLPEHVDVIIVHGCPARPDGQPSTCNLRRARAAVEAWRRGLSSLVLFTGGPTLNRFSESDVTAQAARGLGLPDAAILVESQSRHTVTNLSVAKGMMRDRGLHTALLVSESMHLVWCKQLADFYRMHTFIYPADMLPPYTAEYMEREPHDQWEPWNSQTAFYGRPTRPR